MAQPFVIQRLLDAPRELLWEVLTQPQHLPHWLGPRGSSMAHSSLDFRVGGSFHYCLHTPGDLPMWGQWHLRERLPGPAAKQSLKPPTPGTRPSGCLRPWPTTARSGCR